MARAGEGKRILVVEDEDNIAFALSHLLSSEGYRHSRVNDGDLALDQIRDLHPDLVLLDVMLPNKSGYEICQSVRLSAEFSDVKILMMTARGRAIEQKKGLALGADGFIAKPFALSDLKAELHRLLYETA